MASVTSLDQDMRQLRLGRYTPSAANEARTWIESTLGHSLPSGDLLEGLRDGVALCELANLVLPPPGIKYKKSPMPFIQMENISHFLKACEMPPLNLPAHDRFLTVDLYESKDPTQVLQCLGAFSRQAHASKPNSFRTTIGPRKAGAPMSPNSTGGAAANGNGMAAGRDSMRSPPSTNRYSAAMPSSARAMSPALTGGSTGSQGSRTSASTGPVSSWSKKSDQTSTAPAWNIHQYGYMGGANQGSQGVSFGSRRQITSPAPGVPSLQEKERQRRLKTEEEERARGQRQMEREEQERRIKQEEEQARVAEEAAWEEETRRLREQERTKLDEQKRQWEEDERRWREREEARKKEDEMLPRSMTAASGAKRPPEKPRVPSSGILRGQTLAQYQQELAASKGSTDGTTEETPEQIRVRELEEQLEDARERERVYQAEREERLRSARGPSSTSGSARPGTAQSQASSAAATERPPSAGHMSEVSWAGDEREYLRKAWQSQPHQKAAVPAPSQASRPLPVPQVEEQEPEALGSPSPPSLPQRQGVEPSSSNYSLPVDLPQPGDGIQQATSTNSFKLASSPLGSPNRPVPAPGKKEYEAYSPEQRRPNRTDDYLTANTAPTLSAPRISASHEAGDTSLEQQRDRDARFASQSKTKAGGWASKSLLEREMEKERERQREWEENQKRLKDAPRDSTQGTAQGQSWDVNQYGFVGGDSQNRGSSVGSGINFGGRRQILGPRPPP